MILRETLGLAADGSQKAYRHDDVAAFLTATAFPLTYNPRRVEENQVHAPRHAPESTHRPNARRSTSSSSQSTRLGGGPLPSRCAPC